MAAYAVCFPFQEPDYFFLNKNETVCCANQDQNIGHTVESSFVFSSHPDAISPLSFTISLS